MMNPRSLLMQAAELAELQSKPFGGRSGKLGLTGLATLKVLLFRHGPTPSYRQLRRATGFCRGTISKALKRLQAAGFLRIEHRSSQVGRLANAYHFPLSLPGRRQEVRLERKIDDAGLELALAKLGARILAGEAGLIPSPA